MEHKDAINGYSAVMAAHVFYLSMPVRQVSGEGQAGEKTVDNIIISLTTDSGITGWGCAAPVTDATGEKIEKTADAITGVLVPGLTETPPRTFREILRMVEESVPDAPAARAAFDIALYDIWSKQMSASLLMALGPCRYGIKTSAAVDSADPDEMVMEAGRLLSKGFKTIRIRGGENHGEDIDRLRTLKNEYGKGIAIRLDGRGMYTPEQAREVLKAVGQDIEIFEQPTPAGDIDALCDIARESPVPVAADESAVTERDAIDLFQRGIPIVKVKLMKCGGLGAASRICEIAKVLGKTVIVGCGMETGISAAAAAHLALSQPAAGFADLDGYLRVETHAVSSGPKVKDGVVEVNDRPGLGIEVRKKYLKE